jgi:hypothetical protein
MSLNKPIKWDKSIEKLFQNAVRSKSAITNQLRNYKSVLEDVLEVLKLESEFEFHPAQQEQNIITSTSSQAFVDEPEPVRKRRLQAVKTFLGLWEYLLSIIDVLTYSEKSLAFDIILYLMRRSELDPVYFKSSINTTRASKRGKIMGSLLQAIGAPSTAMLEQEILRQHHQVLIRTQRYVVDTILKGRRHETIYEELFTFCAAILAINCFRLVPTEELQSFIENLCKKFYGKSKEEYVTQEVHKIVDSNLNTIRTLPSATSELSTRPTLEQLDQIIHLKANKEFERSRMSLNITELEQQKIDAQLLTRLFRYNALLSAFVVESDSKNTGAVTVKERQDMVANIRSCYDWIPTLEHSHNFFITFFTNFVIEVKRLMVGEHTLRYWRLIPGYNNILLLHYVQEGLNHLLYYMKHEVHVAGASNSASISEKLVMQNKDFRQWLESTFTVLMNPRFVAVLMDMFFCHTNGYDLDQVFFTLDWADEWFNELRAIRLKSQQRHAVQLVLHHRNRIHESAPLYPIDIFMGILPNNFDHVLFESAIERLIDTDHFQIVTRTLIFIYNILDMFTGRERLKFIYELLLKKHFYTLFLHWSDDVRACFYRILTYKIRRISRLDLQDMETQVNPIIKEKKKKQKKITSPPSPRQNLSGSPPTGDFASMMRKRSGSRKVEDDNKISTQVKRRTDDENNDDRSRLRGVSVPRRSLDSARPTLHQSSSIADYGDQDEEEDEEEAVETTARRRSLDGEVRISHNYESEFSSGYGITLYETEMERLRMEKAVDLILDSKIQVRLENMKYIVEHGKELEDLDDMANLGISSAQHLRLLESQLKFKEKDVPCPKHMYKFVGNAVQQYSLIKQESDKWRASVLNHLINKRNQLMNTGTITVIPVIYPNLVFPKFTLASEQTDIGEDNIIKM